MVPALVMADRAAAWVESEPSVRAALVFGSVARGEATEESDLDLLLVAASGQLGELWGRRQKIAAEIHERPIIFARDVHWQHSHRYQSWDDQTELDMTFADAAVADEALAGGYQLIKDTAAGNVGARLTAGLEHFRRPELDAAGIDDVVWVTLDYLDGRLRHGEMWAVRAGLTEVLNDVVIPALGGVALQAHAELDAADLRLLHQAVPVSDEPAELRRALRATLALWDLAVARWAARTGLEPSRCPLAPLVRARLGLLLAHDRGGRRAVLRAAS
jgi:hypothetical protein